MQYKTLEDFIPHSHLVKASIQVMRQHMKSDGAHDEGHLVRVARHALAIQKIEGGELDTILPACILHDIVNVPKDDQENRPKASLLSADLATDLLWTVARKDPSLEISCSYAFSKNLDRIHHAIHAHSFSANVTCNTIEAMIVQDADRLEALGLIGICRLFSVGGSIGRTLFHTLDPQCESRDPEECTYTLDHFYVKLNQLPVLMKTPTGAEKAEKLRDDMVDFIGRLRNEIVGSECE